MAANPEVKRKVIRIFERTSIYIFMVVALVLALLAGSSSNTLLAGSQATVDILAYAHAMPDRGWVPLTVYYSAFGSFSTAGSIVRYEWDLDANGYYDYSVTQPEGYAQYTYSKPGTYVIGLRVTDEFGHTATDSLEITIKHPTASSVDYWTVFDDSQVRKITFEVTQANWNHIWSDIEAKYTIPVDAVIFSQRLEDVGLRMRGQFSLRESGEKKPWKIDTDYYIDGQEYKNLKQLLFVNSITDPSLLEEKLAYEMMQFAGLPASFVCYVEIWFDISDDEQPPEFWGVYSMIERVDRKFLANRFGQDAKDGNLYKASHAQRGPMDLVYYGDAIEDFPRQNEQYAYGKMTNEEDADYSDIVNLTWVIDGQSYPTPEDFAQALEAVFNVDGFLRYMAVVDATMNWDIYPYTGNNYYLFHNPVTDKFEWIPWDLSWGGNPQHPVFENLGPGLTDRTPLHTRVFQVPEYRLRYAAYLDLLMQHFFNPLDIEKKVSAYQALILPRLSQGTGDKMFYGGSSAFNIEQARSVGQGLVDRVSGRNDFLQSAIFNYQNVPPWGSQNENKPMFEGEDALPTEPQTSPGEEGQREE